MKTTPFSLVRLFFIIALAIPSVAAAPYAKGNEVQTSAHRNIYEDMGGQPCFDGSIFTCVSIEVPLDHFNPSDSRTISVTFAVLPASGKRKGMFVTATGGPGYSGVAAADPYTALFDPSITEVFDVLFFDQRGIAASGDQACPYAANIYYQQPASGITRRQELALKQSARTFSANCVRETSNPDLLPYLGTKQAVEDLESFRQLIGDDKLWLYGESYGTQYAQTYASMHKDHLAGLILDGTVDLTLDGHTYYVQQAQAFNNTLVASLAACKGDPSCRKDMNGKPLFDYDLLAAKLKKSPLIFNFPLPGGGFAKRKFTFTNLEFVATSQMYTESDRMIFVRALAAYADHADLTPLARLLYLDMGVDPQTLAVVPDPTFSDAVYYGVECQDYGYPGNTPNQKAENYLKAADAYEASIPRFASILYSDMPCAYWPHPTTDLTRPDYLHAEGVPTFVLGATADPATPLSNGLSVYHHLADGYLVVQQGGPHVIFGRGNECPDALITDFLVNDVVPSTRETTCDGVVMDDYVPLAPHFAAEFKSPRKALSAMETEIYYLPEFYYWDGVEPTSVGCGNGGTLSFATDANNDSVSDFVLTKCAFTNNFIMTGTGSYDATADQFILQVKTTGRWTCNLQYIRSGEDISVTGKCDGKSMKEKQRDEDFNFHILPNRPKLQEDHHHDN